MAWSEESVASGLAETAATAALKAAAAFKLKDSSLSDDEGLLKEGLERFHESNFGRGKAAPLHPLLETPGEKKLGVHPLKRQTRYLGGNGQ